MKRLTFAFILIFLAATAFAATEFVTMQQRRDTAANWTSADYILASGEIGVESDTLKFKIGNGVTSWNFLAYQGTGGGGGGSSAWVDITGTPTTLAGYGIIDALSTS